MNRLLALADFSPASENALHYAAALAGEQGLPLTLLHVYAMPVAYTPDEMVLPLLPAADTRELAEERLTDLLARMRTAFPDLSLQSRLLYGDIGSALDAGDDESALDGHTLIAANDAAPSGSWLTSDIPDLLRNAPRTVLAVPEGCSYQPVRAIGLALDPQKAENLPLAPLIDWVRRTGARLHVVSVGSGAHPVPEAVSTALQAVAPEYHIVTGAESIESGLEQVVRTLNLDWLVMTPHPHGLLAGLFRKGHVQALAQKTPVPLLALHLPNS